MSDSIANFTDFDDPTVYSGLTDTAIGYTGSSTMQDVTLGSPLLLDTSYGLPSTSVTDLMAPVPLMADPDLGSVPTQLPTQSLTGASDTPPSAASIRASTPTPAVAQPNNDAWSALTALSKFGSSMSALMGNQPKVISAAPSGPQVTTAAGAALPNPAFDGTNTVILLIVVGALIALLVRGD